MYYSLLKKIKLHTPILGEIFWIFKKQKELNLYILLELIEQEGNGFLNTLINNRWLVLV